MTAHDHGDSEFPHYVSTTGGIRLADWQRLPPLKSLGLPPGEVTPVFAGVPGDRGGVPTHFIQFAPDPAEAGSKLAIHLLSVEWKNVQT